MKKIVIQDNIPLPTKENRYRPTQFRTGLKKALKEMRPGQSFLYPDHRRHSVTQTAREVGVEIIIAKVNIAKIRVWKK